MTVLLYGLAGAGRCGLRPAPGLWQLVEEQLRECWSPQQIAEWLRIEFPDDASWWVSHELIYQAIYIKGRGSLRIQLAACLRTGRAKRRPRNNKGLERGRIPDMINISERPAEAADRAVPGHWEGDLIIGKGGHSAVATLVERSTRFGMLIKLDNKTAEHVAERLTPSSAEDPAAAVQIVDLGPRQRNGPASPVHRRYRYRCVLLRPAFPWRRGSNENWNGLVRQYLPKGTELSVHSQDDLDNMAQSLNNRPRMTLDWDNPAERLNQLVAANP